jgi:hypothetical protein
MRHKCHRARGVSRGSYRPDPRAYRAEGSRVGRWLYGGNQAGGGLDPVVEHFIVHPVPAPNVEQLRKHYENLEAKLAAEGISPQIPWLYGFKLDFQFR